MSVRERLRDLDARPETAAAIAREGDPAVLPELLAAYEEPVETGRSELLKAMSALAAAARKALRHQWRTPDWHATVERLTASGDPDLRATAEALRG